MALTTHRKLIMRVIILALVVTVIYTSVDMYQASKFIYSLKNGRDWISNTTFHKSSLNLSMLLNNRNRHYNADNDFRDLSKVRLLIAVLTSPKSLPVRTLSVKQTWGKRCKKIIYFSTEENKEFPTIRLDVHEGYKHLTAKTMSSFRYIYEHFFDDYDWFMKADDDTYVIVENLLYYLSDKNYSEPVYFGDRFRPLVEQGYHGGGAGYVLSKEALRRFGEKSESVNCSKDFGAEDVEMGKCMQKLGVRIIDSMDSENRTFFHSLTPHEHLFGTYPKWYLYYDPHNGTFKGRSSMSDYLISFHKVTPENMYLIDFYIYKLIPYGIVKSEQTIQNISENITS